MKNSITLNSYELRPSTLAAIIADLLENQVGNNKMVIRSLLSQLDASVGEDEAIELLVEEGINPEQIYLMPHIVVTAAN